MRFTVWIIEDHEEYCRNLFLLLQEEEWVASCRTFSSGEAMLTTAAGGGVADLMLLDLGLPGMDGITALKKIKQISPATKIMILTINHDQDQVFNAISAGADGYLLKTAKIDTILHSIKDMMNGGFPINPYIARKVMELFNNSNKKGTDYGLSERENQVLQYLIDGVPRKTISEQMHVSYHTIDFHIRNIYKKLQVNTLSDAVAKGIKEKIVKVS